MKILEEKHDFGVFPMKVTCKQSVDQYGFTYGEKVDFCGSTLEIEASDICAHSWEKYPTYKGIDYGVFCPVCGQFVTIDRNLLPESVKKNAPERSIHNNMV